VRLNGVALALLCAVLGAACTSGGGDKAPTVEPSATAAPAATANPLGPAEVDGARAFEHVRKLAAEIGPRLAGTPGERNAAAYIEEQLKSYGYTVSLQSFEFDATQYLPARVDAGEYAGAAVAFGGSIAGEASGPLVRAGIGRREDFPAEGIAGSIVLIERGTITFADKVRNAAAAGAVGVIISNNEPGLLVGDIPGGTTIPAVGVRPEVGQDLGSRIATGAADVKVTVTPPRGTAVNVVAMPPGAATCETVTGGHYDSVAVTGGADDNASGTGAVLEVARVTAASRLPGAHCFVLFSAEELGLVGSRAFVERLRSAELDALRFMLNLDVVGNVEQLTLIGDAGLAEEARVQAQELGVDVVTGELPPNAGSDHQSFAEQGVPVLMFNRNDGLIHTPEDAIGRIQADSLGDAVSVAYETLAALSAP